MVRSLDLPVLSLVVPNIQKLNAVTTDSISCMWTVFSKCKDNLEHGRRLENLSWRLWFRESRINRPAQAQPSPPLPLPPPPAEPLGQTPNTSVGRCGKHISPDSLKHILSSLEASPMDDISAARPVPRAPTSPQPQTAPEPPPTVSAAAPLPPSPTPFLTPMPPRTRKFFMSDGDDEDSETADEANTPRDDMAEQDSDAVHLQSTDDTVPLFVHNRPPSLGHFPKQVCRPCPPQPSLLTSLLASSASHIQASHRTLPVRYSTDLSESLRTCVAWERYQNVSPARLALHKNPVTPITSWFDTFRGW